MNRQKILNILLAALLLSGQAAGAGPVADAAAACAEIRKRGGKVVREPGPMKHGTTVIAFIEDPDGYKVELIEKKG